MKIFDRKLVRIAGNVWTITVEKEQIEEVVGKVVNIVGKSICRRQIGGN